VLIFIGAVSGGMALLIGASAHREMSPESVLGSASDPECAEEAITAAYERGYNEGQREADTIWEERHPDQYREGEEILPLFISKNIYPIIMSKETKQHELRMLRWQVLDDTMQRHHQERCSVCRAELLIRKGAPSQSHVRTETK